MTILTRRTALIGSLSTLFAAPAIVRASSLMPVSVRAVPTSDSALKVFDITTFKVDGLAVPYSTFTLKNIGLSGTVRCGETLISRGQTVRITTA